MKVVIRHVMQVIIGLDTVIQDHLGLEGDTDCSIPSPRYTFRILNLKIFGLEVSQIKVLLNIRLNELILNVKVLYNIWFNAINSTALHLAKFKIWSYVSDLCYVSGWSYVPRPDSFFFEYASNKLLHFGFYIISNFAVLLVRPVWWEFHHGPWETTGDGHTYIYCWLDEFVESIQCRRPRVERQYRVPLFEKTTKITYFLDKFTLSCSSFEPKVLTMILNSVNYILRYKHSEVPKEQAMKTFGYIGCVT